MRLVALVATAIGLSAMASADIIFTTNVGDITRTENILFNEDGLLQSGSKVQGITNQSGWVIDFHEAGIDLSTPAAGQARIEPLNPDDLFDTLKIESNGAAIPMVSAIFNVKTFDLDGELTVTVNANDGSFSETFELRRGGENWIGLEAINSEYIYSIGLSSTVDLADVRQVRIGVVPEPATMGALAMGLLAVVARRRRK